jgi:AcrR family transcriptional regulator
VTGVSTATGAATGGLQDVLRRAAVDVIAERGVGAFSIREVARRAGVSHAAPGYHFGDVRGLLTSVAVEGFVTLHSQLAKAFASTDDPVERLTAVGRAYVAVAVSHPAHCEVMFRHDLIDAHDPACQSAGHAAFGVLLATITAIAERLNPRLEVLDAAKLCWSAMQGLVQIQPTFAHIDPSVGGAVTLDEAVARFTPLFIAGMTGAAG